MNPRDASAGTIVNALTIDVEDYFQVSAFAAHIPRASWDSLPCRVEANIDRILALLAEHRRPGDIFHPRLDRGTVSGPGPPHRRCRT